MSNKNLYSVKKLITFGHEGESNIVILPINLRGFTNIKNKLKQQNKWKQTHNCTKQ